MSDPEMEKEIITYEKPLKGVLGFLGFGVRWHEMRPTTRGKTNEDGEWTKVETI